MESPQIRIRISHAHTLKDGWRCDSTTVEIVEGLASYDDAPGEVIDLMKQAMADAFEAGKAEAESRTKLESSRGE